MIPFDQNWLCPEGINPELNNDINNHLLKELRNLANPEALCFYVRQLDFQACGIPCVPSCRYRIAKIGHPSGEREKISSVDGCACRAEDLCLAPSSPDAPVSTPPPTTRPATTETPTIQPTATPTQTPDTSPTVTPAETSTTTSSASTSKASSEIKETNNPTEAGTNGATETHSTSTKAQSDDPASESPHASDTISSHTMDTISSSESSSKSRGSIGSTTGTLPAFPSTTSITNGQTPQPTIGSGNGNGNALPANAAASSSHKPNAGAIAGGVIGGLLLLALLFAFLLYRRQKRSHVPPSAEFIERGLGNPVSQPNTVRIPLLPDEGRSSNRVDVLPDYKLDHSAALPLEKAQ